MRLSKYFAVLAAPLYFASPAAAQEQTAPSAPTYETACKEAALLHDFAAITDHMRRNASYEETIRLGKEIVKKNSALEQTIHNMAIAEFDAGTQAHRNEAFLKAVASSDPFDEINKIYNFHLMMADGSARTEIARIALDLTAQMSKDPDCNPSAPAPAALSQAVAKSAAVAPPPAPR